MTGWKAAVLLVAVVLAGLIVTTWKRWWPRTSGVTVTYQGQAAPDARVYRGPNCLLIDLTKQGDSRYLLYPAARELGEAQVKRFIFLPGVLFSKDFPAQYVWIGKSDVMALIEFQPEGVKFTGVKGKRIGVTWRVW